MKGKGHILFTLFSSRAICYRQNCYFLFLRTFISKEVQKTEESEH
jgi:hypothetical protein